ncbi:MAG TPA: putative zinc-binding metallopeptidase, partial [Burkholderiaceae bacterium]|nr:putative zinc-binding metallopeptidase [Burkholderiaceae bacterium]
CHNHTVYQACNFAVQADDPNPLCVSCRQTRLLPDLSVADNLAHWCRVEVAKRRLYYTLAKLELLQAAPNGPVFEFLADLPGAPGVMTGHRDGVITLNIAEADDEECTRRRIALHEPYRTLLGHLRHESGHYYWETLIRAQDRTDEFNAVFGDASIDYTHALQRHYANDGTAQDWHRDHVSAYATSHPLEDWAETWAHYLHMVDLLETASAYRTSVAVPGSDDPRLARIANPFGKAQSDFDVLVAQWVPITLMVNSLNRSLGQSDAYPFALSDGALRKLRYVHEVIRAPMAPTPKAASAAINLP